MSPETPNYNEGRFHYVGLYYKKVKNETFHTRYSKGKQKNHSSTEDEDSSLIQQYQYVTLDDLYLLSTSYLRENALKCPECSGEKNKNKYALKLKTNQEDRQNLIEHGFKICSNCGLILAAPPTATFIVDDLTPIRKVAATVDDFPPVDFTQKSSKKKKREPKKLNVIKEAHDKAYQKYKKELHLIDPELQEENKVYNKNDPLNPEYWEHYKKKVLKESD